MAKNILLRSALSALLMLLTVACHPVIAPPQLIQEFKSTSGRTIIQYYTYHSTLCWVGNNCNFRGLLRVPAGFDQVEVFLSGFTIETQAQADKVWRVTAEVQKNRYNQATGEIDVDISGLFGTASSQPYSYQITFLVILTDATAATFTHIDTGCTGIAECHVTKSLSGSILVNQQYIGLGTSRFDLGSDSGPLLINALSAHIDNIIVTPPDVQVDYLCALRDASLSNKMFCEWSASIMAFDPTEMEQNNSSIFPQYTFLGQNTLTAERWTAHVKSQSGVAIAGFLDGLEGVTFFYGPGQEHAIWLIESSVTNFATVGTPPHTASTDYGLLIGTTFGDRNNAQLYSFQESRSLGLLH